MQTPLRVGRVWPEDPTPLEAAMLAETVEHLLGGLTPREREIASLALQGYTATEISTTAAPKATP